MSDDVQRPAGCPAPDPLSTPSLMDLALVFGAMGMSGIGGVLPWARRMLVEQRRWLTPEQFNEIYALCHFLPGPNIVNLVVVFGSRSCGLRGALVSLAALIGPPVLIVTALGALYVRFGQIPALQGGLAGLAAAAAGLLIAMAVKMLEPLVRKRALLGLAVAATAFVAMGVLKWPLLWVVLILAPVSVALAWWRQS